MQLHSRYKVFHFLWNHLDVLPPLAMNTKSMECLKCRKMHWARYVEAGSKRVENIQPQNPTLHAELHVTKKLPQSPTKNLDVKRNKAPNLAIDSRIWQPCNSSPSLLLILLASSRYHVQSGQDTFEICLYWCLAGTYKIMVLQMSITKQKPVPGHYHLLKITTDTTYICFIFLYVL